MKSTNLDKVGKKKTAFRKSKNKRKGGQMLCEPKKYVSGGKQKIRRLKPRGQETKLFSVKKKA